MRKIFMAVAVFAFAIQASAQQFVCENSENNGAYQAVAWDTESKEAKIRDGNGVNRNGNLISTRQTPNGMLYNLDFDFPTGFTDTVQRAEMAVFTTAKREFRAFGSIYSTIDGKHLLDIDLGNVVLSCVSST